MENGITLSPLNHTFISRVGHGVTLGQFRNNPCHKKTLFSVGKALIHDDGMRLNRKLLDGHNVQEPASGVPTVTYFEAGSLQ